jgi:tetratricopeptide (TPR) repeat protein
MVNKQTLINVGGFNEKIKYSEDWDLWLRIAQAGGFVYNEKPLIKIRRHNENASKKIKVMLQAEINILEKYDLQIIEEAIYMRNISVEQNILDYVSILYRLDKWDLGNLKLNDLLKYNEKNASVHFYKGLYFLKTNQLNKAKACFQTVIRLQPQNGASLNNLAAILAIEQEFTLANKLLYEAISYYEGYVDAQKNIEKLNLFSKGGKITLDDLQFTWRELRPTLLRYSE